MTVDQVKTARAIAEVLRAKVPEVVTSAGTHQLRGSSIFPHLHPGVTLNVDQ